MADVLLNRLSDSIGYGILYNTSAELIKYSDSVMLDVISGNVDSSLLLSAALSGGGGSGIEQSTLDSANDLIATLRIELDDASSNSGSSQRWIS